MNSKVLFKKLKDFGIFILLSGSVVICAYVLSVAAIIVKHICN